MRKKVLISWSSGKDSAWMLYLLRQDPTVDIIGLGCTVNSVFERVAVHGVRIELLKQQADSVNLPLYLIPIPYPCDNDEYIKSMTAFLQEAEKQGVECIAYGDLFLQNVRQYRENLLKNTDITPLFPLWGTPTKILSKQMVSAGLKAMITCVDSTHVPIEFAGREYNESFLIDLPNSIDPCGENGEFHSFAFDGPMFQYPLELSVGETVARDGCFFTDLLLSEKSN